MSAALDRLLVPVDVASSGVVTSWPVQIDEAYSTAESRRLQSSRPLRSMTISQATYTLEEAALAEALMMSLSDGPNLAPLWADVTRLSSSIDASATLLPCDTTYRRFFIGHRVAIYTPSRRSKAEAFEVGEIASVSSNSITLTVGLSQAFPKNARVVPLIECDPVLASGGSFFRDWVTSGTTSYIERAGDTQLPAIVEPGTDPPDYPTYEGIPILTGLRVLKSPRIGYSADRAGELATLGLHMISNVRGERAAKQWNLPLAFRTRAEAWAVMGFIDSRGGSAYPFWLPNPIVNLDFVTTDLATIDFAAYGDAADWDKRPYLAIHLRDGSVLIRENSGVERIGEIDRISLAEEIPAGTLVDDIRRVTLAQRVRLTAAGVEESWRTPEAMTMNISIVEIIKLGFEIASIAVISTIGLALGFVPALCDQTADNSACVQCGEQVSKPYTLPEGNPSSIPVNFVGERAVDIPWRSDDFTLADGSTSIPVPHECYYWYRDAEGGPSTDGFTATLEHTGTGESCQWKLSYAWFDSGGGGFRNATYTKVGPSMFGDYVFASGSGSYAASATVSE